MTVASGGSSAIGKSKKEKAMTGENQPGRSASGQASAQEGHGKVSASEIQKYMSGMDFPADKSDLVEHARQQDAPQEVLDVMENLPEQEYGTVADVSKGIGQAMH